MYNMSYVATFKIGSRSSKPYHFLSVSQCCIHAGLVRMHWQFYRESTDKAILYNLSYEETLKVGSRSPKYYHIKSFPRPIYIKKSIFWIQPLFHDYRVQIRFNWSKYDILSAPVTENKVSHAMRKPVFGVSDHGRLKPACPATETR